MEAEPLPLTDEELSLWWEPRAASLEGAPEVRAAVDALVPELKPVLTRLATDDEKRLWVGRTAPAGAAPLFDVFDEAGSYIGSVRLFPGMSEDVGPVIRNGRLYAVVRGEFDEPYVVSAPLPESLRTR